MTDNLASGHVWVIGAGRMAKEYTNVLTALGVDFSVVGRGEDSAKAFTEETSIPCATGGIVAASGTLPAPTRAIVGVNIEGLSQAVRDLIDLGCIDILVEKPAGVDVAEIEALADAVRTAKARVIVAYNRRFYASIETARRMIAEDGGAVSMSFEFTEVSDIIAGSAFNSEVKENWLLANSTHVIDTAYFLCGAPARQFTHTAGALDWHSRAARFVGSGETVNGVLYSYIADWDAPGRWGIEVNTRQRRLVLRPMEQLQVQARGSFTTEPVETDDRLDQDFKPGLYEQTRVFLSGEADPRLLDLDSHLAKARDIYAPMLNSWSQAPAPAAG